MRTRIRVGHGVKHQNDDDILIHHSENVEHHLKHCKWVRENERSRPDGLRPLVSLPLSVWLDLWNKGMTLEQNRDTPWVFYRWLAQNPYFKTTEKKIYIPSKV